MMDDVLFVRGFECFRHLFCNPERLLDGNGSSLEPFFQGIAFHQLHHDATRRSGALEPVNVRDVGMIQCSEYLSFTLEAGEPFGIGREYFRQELQRDVTLKLCIARTVNLTHAAFCQQGFDRIRTELPPDDRLTRVFARFRAQEFQRWSFQKALYTRIFRRE